jgi:predicted 2-oxoglutarate/Fe(II)-dependent dioxygenase YbiX
VELEDRTFKSADIDPYWNDRFIWHADIASARPEAGAIMSRALGRAIARIRAFYRLMVPIYPDLLQIVRWRSGMSMPPHADNANPDGTPHKMAYRDLSGIMYLNDDYEGGELYFTALDVAVKPKRGLLVGLTAGFHHEHAVLRVESGTRLTMPFFLTFDPARADRSLLRDSSI